TQTRNEKSSGNGVCGSVLPFVSSVSEPCKPVVRGSYRSPQNNHSVGDKVVVLDFVNSEAGVLLGVHLEHERVHLFRYLLKKMVEMRNHNFKRISVCAFFLLFICIARCGLDVICKKKRKRTRYFSVGSSHHEASDDMNHGGVTGSYVDIGDCEWVCEYCRATFWYGERVKRDSNSVRPHYYRCCGGRKVVCKWPCEPPADIKEIFGNKGFQENIRAY
nr:DNA topoisomerase 2 [Tanacetum cinerariifolium]